MTLTKNVVTLAHPHETDGTPTENVWYLSTSDPATFTSAVLAPLLANPGDYINSQIKPPPFPVPQSIFIIFHYGLNEANYIPVATVQGMYNTNIIAVRCSPIGATPPANVATGDVSVCYVPSVGLAFSHLDLPSTTCKDGSTWIMNPQMFVQMLNLSQQTVSQSNSTQIEASGPEAPQPLPDVQVIYSLAPDFRFHYEYPKEDVPNAPQCIKFAGPAQYYTDGTDTILQVTIDAAWTLPWQTGSTPHPIV